MIFSQVFVFIPFFLFKVVRVFSVAMHNWTKHEMGIYYAEISTKSMKATTKKQHFQSGHCLCHNFLDKIEFENIFRLIQVHFLGRSGWTHLSWLFHSWCHTTSANIVASWTHRKPILPWNHSKRPKNWRYRFILFWIDSHIAFSSERGV